MPRESLPKERASRAPNGVPWGDPRWGRTVDPKEIAEVIRKREGVVGDDGIRRIRMSKTGAEYDDPRLEAYEDRGYKVEDTGRRYVLSIPQKEYERLERERMARTEALNPKPTKSNEFRTDTEEELAPVSSRDFLDTVPAE